MRGLLVCIVLLLPAVAVAQTEYPTLLFDSNNGNDAQASGAGPATAVFGTAATTSANGEVITLDGSPDLSGVVDDGSHVIYFADATSGERNFSAIIGKGANTVTVPTAQAFRASVGAGESIDWAIGGVRASALTGDSAKLYDNDGAAGDAMSSWTMQMQSGHTESLSDRIFFRRAGSTGRITLQGEPGAAVRPVVTHAPGNTVLFQTIDYVALRYFDITSNHTGALYAIFVANLACEIDGLHIYNSGVNAHDHGIYCANSAAQANFRNNYVSGMDNGGINLKDGSWCSANGNLVKDCGQYGIEYTWSNHSVWNNIVVDIGTTTSHHGIVSNSSNQSTTYMSWVFGNTVDNCAGDGIRDNVAGNGMKCRGIWNNVVSNCGGFGIHMSNSMTAEQFRLGALHFYNNNTYQNGDVAGSQNYKLGAESAADSIAVMAINDPQLDPQYNAPGSPSYDYRLGENLKGAAYPSVFPFVTANVSSKEPGALQREETGTGPSGPVSNQAVAVGF